MCIYNIYTIVVTCGPDLASCGTLDAKSKDKLINTVTVTVNAVRRLTQCFAMSACALK